MQKLRYVDALRGLAITGVLFVHCGQFGSGERLLPPLFRTIVSSGSLGVQLFFVVSAFTLFLSLRRRMGVEKAPVRNFFIRRFFRIAPMYYLGICFYLWLDGRGPRFWLGDAPGISTGNIVSNFLFLHGFNPYWINSLVPGGWMIAVEMLFYCLVPLLVLHIANKRQAVNFLLVALVARLILEVLLSKIPLIPDAQLWGKYLKLYLPNQMPVFALGILMFFLVSEEHGEGDRAAIRPLQLVIFAMLLIAQFALGIQALPSHVVCGMAFVVLGIALGRREFAVLVNPVFVHLGRVSYSMYVSCPRRRPSLARHLWRRGLSSRHRQLLGNDQLHDKVVHSDPYHRGRGDDVLLARGAAHPAHRQGTGRLPGAMTVLGHK